MISTSDNIWKDRAMKSMETIAELNETICRLRKHIVTADTEHGELVLRLAASRAECERLRTALVIIAEWDCKCRWACDCSSRMQWIAEAAAGGEDAK